MDLDVAIGVVTAVDLVKVEATNLAYRAVYLYSHLSVLTASLVSNMLYDKLAALGVGDSFLIDRPVSDVVYL